VCEVLTVYVNSYNDPFSNPMPQYSWNTTKVGIKHQLFNQSINFQSGKNLGFFIEQFIYYKLVQNSTLRWNVMWGGIS
jgi:hypothetical protein